MQALLTLVHLLLFLEKWHFADLVLFLDKWPLVDCTADLKQG